MRAGEVHALLGENGAGKSTLIKVLSGAHLPEAGTISIDGKASDIASPLDAQKLGVAVIYQEFNLVPTLSACANIFLGQEHGNFLSPAAERRQASAPFQRLDIQIDPDILCSNLSVAQQQIVGQAGDQERKNLRRSNSVPR